MSKNCGIYLIKNQLNNKVYVGSSKNIKSRIWHHKNCLKHNRHTNRYLQNAWNKYGEEAFEVFKLELCPIEQLFEREKWWMDLFQSYQDSYGYNIAEVTLNGGPGHSEATKALISEGRKKWHKENPDKSNSKPVNVVSFKTFTWKRYASIAEACRQLGLNYVLVQPYLNTKAYQDYAFIDSTHPNRKTLLYNVYLRWLKLNSKANHAAKPFFAYNLTTGTLEKFISRNQFRQLTGRGISPKNLELGHKRGNYVVGHTPEIIQIRLHPA